MTKKKMIAIRITDEELSQLESTLYAGQTVSHKLYSILRQFLNEDTKPSQPIVDQSVADISTDKPVATQKVMTPEEQAEWDAEFDRVMGTDLTTPRPHNKGINYVGKHKGIDVLKSNYPNDIAN